MALGLFNTLYKPFLEVHTGNRVVIIFKCKLLALCLIICLCVVAMITVCIRQVLQSFYCTLCNCSSFSSTVAYFPFFVY